MIKLTERQLRDTIKNIIGEMTGHLPVEIFSIEPAEEEEVVWDMTLPLEDDYPTMHTDEEGRMFDYGHVKSDSHEGRMSKAKLHRMGKMAQSLHDRLEDGDDLPGWVQDKITTAEDRLQSAHDYIDYKIHRMENQGISCNESKIRRMARKYFISVL